MMFVYTVPRFSCARTTTNNNIRCDIGNTIRTTTKDTVAVESIAYLTTLSLLID
jgi:hypothetical protein